WLPYSGTNWPQAGTVSSATTTGADLRFETSAATGQAAPYLGQGFPVANVKGENYPSQVAIDLKNVGVTASSGYTGATFGSTTATEFNVFDSHRRSIVAENSNLQSHNNVFQNTKNTGPVNGSKSF